MEKLSSKSSEVVGFVEAATSAEGFEMSVLKEAVGRNDFVEVIHEDKPRLLIIKDVKRVGNKFKAKCVVVGSPPKTPFRIGCEVYKAREDTIREVLGLKARPAESLFIGYLKDYQDIKVWLPVDKLGRVFIVGKPGSGKSYTMGVIAEELIKKEIPLVIIDPHGEYSSLKIAAEKASRDVTPRSYAEHVVEYADLSLNPSADLDIAFLANAKPEDIISQGQCTVVNLRGLSLEKQKDIVADVMSKLLEAAFSKKIPPFFLALDEAHLFAGRDRSTTSSIARRFSQEGRKFGANVIVMTQRPQLLDMTVRSLSGTWIIHRLTDPNDVKIAIESGGLSKEWEHDINWLESGEAVVTGEVVEKLPIVIKVRERETKHGAPSISPLQAVKKTRGSRARKKVLTQIAKPKLEEEIPQVAENLPQAYIAPILEPKLELSDFAEKRGVKVTVLKKTLVYVPILVAEANVEVSRKKPEVSYSEIVRKALVADDKVGKVDWRKQSFSLGLSAEDLLNQPLLDAPREHGEHLKTCPQLKSKSDVESLMKSFIAYATSKATKRIYYHPILRVQVAGSLEEFKEAVRGEIDKLRRERLLGIEAHYKKMVSDYEAKIEELREERKKLERIVKEVEKEKHSLEKQRDKARKEGRSTLKLSKQIEVRDERLSRLSKRLKEIELEVKNYANAIKKLEAEKLEELRKAEKELDEMLALAPKSVVVQPKPSEVELLSMQLIWTPAYRAEVKVSKEGVENVIEVYWNAINGRGCFGYCTACNAPIEAVHEGWLCDICLKPSCELHVQRCEECGKLVCSEHAWTCNSCGKTLCSEEERFTCNICGANLCKNCVKRCVVCGEEASYCSAHVVKCSFCGLQYCKIHYDDHLTMCTRCKAGTCAVAAVKCSICKEEFCENCVVKCKVCKEMVCLDDAWMCYSCRQYLCINEKRHQCYICGLSICDDCVKYCASCGGAVCSEHITKCPNCGAQVCVNCLVTKKKMGIFKKVGCKLCMTD